MSNKPLVTVYCAAYNHEQYIKDALDGFISQETSFPFEVIIHDDASTDSTASIIANYAEQYPSLVIPYYEKENQYSKGVGFFRKSILPMARGKYLAFCEGDDYWCDPRKLQMQVDYLEAHPKCAACAHNTLIHDCRYDNESGTVSKMSHDGMIAFARLVMNSGYHTSSLMVRKNIYHNEPEFVTSVKGVGDYPLKIYLGLIGGIYYINRIMSVYRYMTQGSWTDRNSKDSEIAISTNLQIKKMLSLANEWSSREYEDNFQQAIKQVDFNILEKKCKFREMIAPQYSPFFKELSFKHRLRIIVSAICPPLGSFLTQMTRR